MNAPHIIVTYPVEPAKREDILSFFDESARVIFLSDLVAEEREEELRAADVLLSWNPLRELKPKEFSLIRKVRMVQLLSAGADHFPFRDFSRDVVVASNVGAYSEPIAEHVLAMVLALGKNLFREHLKLAQGEFEQRPGKMLQGSVCGILGFGGIGKAAAKLMRCHGVRILALNRTGNTNGPVDFIGTLKDLGQVLAASDILVISLPLNKFTRGLIGKRELETMKPGAILINVARGDIIDEKALFDHLVKHPDFKAGIDTWWFEPFNYGAFRTKYPFFTLPNILGSPHNSAIVPGMDQKATRLAAANIKRFLDGDLIMGEVRREDYL